jgi:hypothetical protein
VGLGFTVSPELVSQACGGSDILKPLGQIVKRPGSKIFSISSPAENLAKTASVRPILGAGGLGILSGDDRDRTGNLRLAKPALSQLSYVPLGESSVQCRVSRAGALDAGHWTLDSKVGVRGFEPRTSALSELRSNQLSYTPLQRLRRPLPRSDKPPSYGTPRDCPATAGSMDVGLWSAGDGSSGPAPNK